MKKYIVTLSLSFVVICSFALKAGATPIHGKTAGRSAGVFQAKPYSEDELLRIQAFKAFTLARKHHLALIASADAK